MQRVELFISDELAARLVAEERERDMELSRQTGFGPFLVHTRDELILDLVLSRVIGGLEDAVCR